MGRCFIASFLTGILLLLSSLKLFAGGTVRGKITDGSTGKPLSGAHVRISGTTLGVISDETGMFRLSGLSAGKKRIKVSYLGYEENEQLVNITDGSDFQMDVALLPKIIETQEVEILDHAIPKNPQESPLRMNRIDIQTIRETPGPGITEVLDLVSGVNLNSTQGIFASNSVVTLRGLSGNDASRTLVMVDDVPINKADEGTVNWNLINRDNVERIDVIKGPGPARYGSNAMGGVINIVTHRPAKRITGTATLDYGTFNTLGFRYFLGGKLKPSLPEKGLYYNLNGFYRRSDGYNPEIPEYLTQADTFSVNTFLREAGIGTKLGYSFNSSHNVEISVDLFNDKRGRGMEIYEIDGAYEEHDSYRILGRYNGQRNRWSWSLDASAYSEHFQRQNEYMSEGEYNLYLVKSTRSDGGISGRGSCQAGSHHLVSAGIDFRNGTVDGEDIYYTSTDLIRNGGKMEIYAVYLQDEASLLGKKLQFTIGLRMNYAVFHDGLFTIENPSYSIQYLVDYQDTLMPRSDWFDGDPKLSAQYRFTPDSRIYLSFGKGFRAPNLDDLCRSGKRQDGFKIANPSLKPENLWNLEAGGDVGLFRMLRVSASAYYSLGKDFMYYISTGDTVNMGYKLTPVTQKRNISEVGIYGAEVDIDCNLLKNLSIFANYAYSHSRINRYQVTDTIADTDLTGKHLTDVPSHKATAGITWKNKIISLNALWKYTGPRWINDLNERDYYLGKTQYPDYSTFDLRLWHTFFNHLTLALNINNIFDKVFIDDRLRQSPGRLVAIELTGKF